jgi:hypothetical protein
MKREKRKGKREEGRGKREEGRGKREVGRGKREEGRGKREGRQRRDWGVAEYRACLDRARAVRVCAVWRQGGA